MRRVLVTGGAGFIGQQLVGSLLDDGDEVVVIDSLHEQVHGQNPATPVFPKKVQFFREDVRHSQAIASIVRRCDPDIIYHLAAETGTGQSYDMPSHYCDVNINGLCYLVEALRGLQEKPRRLVLASSRAVYGEGAYRDPDGCVITPKPRSPSSMAQGVFELFDDLGRPLTPLATREDLEPRPSSLYASTKLMQELVAQQTLESTSTDLVILRLQNVYGPGQSIRNPYTGVLSIFAEQILAGSTLNIFEDGEISRDFIFVEDVVRALVLAGRLSGLDSQPINIGSGGATTIHQAAGLLLSALGASDRRRISGDYRIGDIRHALADISRAKAVLGWTPAIPFQDGVRELARWAAKAHASFAS